MRPPSRQELAGLAEEFVKEEILYREALAFGLDEDDLAARTQCGALGFFVALLVLVVITAGQGLAHEVRPGYLELRQIGDRT